ncbi:hypothetical protein EXIGLDRAFT_760960 [Exidia glandulosa HHB12029]|uniref:DUF4419 domain-containing protein n=1 Tax=Exidia glandulosa HHB12029 TaxID=1314781 RepID=A0A166BHR8_EXIGL|nr:hypothetical protein EXIGLDRAFT_760960 [Exidia glandulosa HHB12029]
MPVTFAVAQLEPAPVEGLSENRVKTAHGLLSHAHQTACKELFNSSFGHRDAALPAADPVLFNNNGLIHTVVRAYNQHHALVLRPDDIWLAILVQFSFFVNEPGNSKRLRGRFVAHEGKEELVVVDVGDRYTADFGRMARAMTDLLATRVVDPQLREWIVPDFSTTTENDRIVASVLMMSTLQEFFSYTFALRCGLPRVTLEGERADWESLVQRADRIQDYGGDAVLWHRLLMPVLGRFVETFDACAGSQAGVHDDAELDAFWSKIVHWRQGGSGPSFLSGWLTAFCVFDAKGKWLPDQVGSLVVGLSHDSNIAVQREYKKHERDIQLLLDGAAYPIVQSYDIPAGCAGVPVKLDDNGVMFDTLMVAGLAGSRVLSTSAEQASDAAQLDTLAPLAAWWLFDKVPDQPTDKKQKSGTRKAGAIASMTHT